MFHHPENQRHYHHQLALLLQLLLFKVSLNTGWDRLQEGQLKSERQSGAGSKVATGELPILESEVDYGSGSRASNKSVK